MATSYLRGELIAVDGLDGAGKGVAINALVQHEKAKGRSVFDVDAYCKENGDFPEPKHWKDFDTLVMSEPGYETVGGDFIRRKALMQGRYTGFITANAFATFRSALDALVTIPAREVGKRTYKSRCFAASLVNQPIQMMEDGSGPDYDVVEPRGNHLLPDGKHGKLVKLVLGEPGNQFSMNNCPPSMLIIPTIQNMQELKARLENRGERDKLENVKLQEKFRPHYESMWLRLILENLGARVEYFDAGVSVSYTKARVVSIVESYLHEKATKEGLFP